MGKNADNFQSTAMRLVRALDLSALHDSEVSPELLSAVGRVADECRSLPFVAALIREIETSDLVYDWNASVVLSRLDADLVAEAMTCVPLGRRHVESTGLAWSFGELSGSRPEIIDWLERVVSEAKKSKTWWRAAFSLQKLGHGDAVERLMGEMREEGLPPLDECLEDIRDERRAVAVLAYASADPSLRGKVAESLKATYLESDDDPTLTNCGWLIGRLNLVDGEVLDRIRELSTDESHDVRYYALYALQNSPRSDGVDIARRALSDHDPLVRRVAVRALTAIGSPECLEILRKNATEERDGKVLAEAGCCR